jgi:hypothetical protein
MKKFIRLDLNDMPQALPKVLPEVFIAYEPFRPWAMPLSPALAAVVDLNKHSRLETGRREHADCPSMRQLPRSKKGETP